MLEDYDLSVTDYVGASSPERGAKRATMVRDNIFSCSLFPGPCSLYKLQFIAVTEHLPLWNCVKSGKIDTGGDAAGEADDALRLL